MNNPVINQDGKLRLRYPDVTTHNLVNKMCVELANEIYEELASRHNTFYKVNRDRADFIKQCAPTLRTDARRALAALLTDPATSQSEKDKIHEALILDNELPRTGTSVVKRGAV